jgi:hypothetical protein
MNFCGRLIGTFFDPGRTFRAISERPLWVDVLIVLLILISLYTYLIFPFGQKDSLRSLEDNAAKLKAKWGESRYASYLERMKGQDRSLTAFLVTPLTYIVGFLFSALIVLGMGRLVSTQGNYLQVFSSLLHANLVDKLLGNGLRLFLISGRKSVLETSTGLPVLFRLCAPRPGGFVPTLDVLPVRDRPGCGLQNHSEEGACHLFRLLAPQERAYRGPHRASDPPDAIGSGKLGRIPPKDANFSRREKFPPCPRFALLSASREDPCPIHCGGLS